MAAELPAFAPFCLRCGVRGCREHDETWSPEPPARRKTRIRIRRRRH